MYFSHGTLAQFMKSKKNDDETSPSPFQTVGRMAQLHSNTQITALLLPTPLAHSLLMNAPLKKKQ